MLPDQIERTGEAAVLAQRDRKLSPLMRQKARMTDGQEPNFCPFGCSMEMLDEHGYCDHLIGFTKDGKIFEPMIAEPITNRDGEKVLKKKVLGGKDTLQKVLPSDRLVQITTDYRVYRKDNPNL